MYNNILASRYRIIFLFLSRLELFRKNELYLSLPIDTLILPVLVAILFNRFSFRKSEKDILVCNIFSIMALFLLVNIRFYMKKVEG